MTDIEKMKFECWDNALHSLGTAYIYEQRSKDYKKKISRLKISSLIIPCFVGLVALGYGFNSNFLLYAIYIAIPLSIIQLLISVPANINNWDGELSYSYESNTDNSILSNNFDTLASRPPLDNNDFHHRIEVLKAKLASRETQDIKHPISEDEKRMGMRYALRYFQRECVGCKTVPVSMESTKCDVCGNFKSKIK
jgi:mobilome CxxCx(11)CxxC protein